MSLEGDCRYCVHQEECINLSVVPFEVPIDTETFFAEAQVKAGNRGLS